MQAFCVLLEFLVLFSIVSTADGACATKMPLKHIDILKKEITCTCKKTSADYQNSCDCFKMPKASNYNLTCYQESFVGMTKRLQNYTKYTQQFLKKTFPNLVNSCKSAYQPCGQMTKVNETVFWDRLTDIFQYFLIHHKKA